jgi:hypothetical protein
MARGGARNRSGPPPVEGSRDSERKGYVLTALPPAGYDGEVPGFPLMAFTVYRWEHNGERRYQVRDDDATAEFRERETELWATAWAYPQACAWSLESWRWQSVAMWVRTAVVCESSEATAADKGAIHTPSIFRRCSLSRLGFGAIALWRMGFARAARSRCTTGSSGSRSTITGSRRRLSRPRSIWPATLTRSRFSPLRSTSAGRRSSRRRRRARVRWSAVIVCAEAVGPVLFYDWAVDGEVPLRRSWLRCGWSYTYRPGEAMGHAVADAVDPVSRDV